jgi:hypothetical protein
MIGGDVCRLGLVNLHDRVTGNDSRFGSGPAGDHVDDLQSVFGCLEFDPQADKIPLDARKGFFQLPGGQESRISIQRRDRTASEFHHHGRRVEADLFLRQVRDLRSDQPQIIPGRHLTPDDLLVHR